MEEHSLYTHYLSREKDVPERELSENTKKIIALVESEDFLESKKYRMSDLNTLQEIIYSARADIRYKLELLDGVIEEFKDTQEWEYRGEKFMEVYEPFRVAVDFMKSADNVFFTLTKVTRGENNSRSYDDNYPEFLSVDEISKYLESRFDETKDSEDDPEWYIVHRHGNNIKTLSYYEWLEWDEKQRFEYNVKSSVMYLLSKRGTVWKCGIDVNDEGIGWEIHSGQFVADYSDIVVFDRRPFYDICHMLYATDDGEETGFYVEDGKLKIFPIEYHVNNFEEFAFELRAYIQEDMSKLSEQEDILYKIQQKYNSMSEGDGYSMLVSIAGRIYEYDMYEGMPVEMVEEEFLK